MSEWPYEQITDHVVEAESRLTSQYDEATRLHGIVSTMAGRVQMIENALWTVLTQRWIPEAVGVQLDELGAIVGEPRLGRSDEPYRAAIQLRININLSGGEPERIIDYMRRITGASYVLFHEIYPAKISMYIDTTITADQAAAVRKIVGAGIGSVFITETGGELPFGVCEEDQDPLPVDRLGFGELGTSDFTLDTGETLELSDGSILGITDVEDPVDSTTGGVIAELFEA